MALLIKIVEKRLDVRIALEDLRITAELDTIPEWNIQYNVMKYTHRSQEKKQTLKISFYNLQFCFKFLVNYFTLKSLPF